MSELDAMREERNHWIGEAKRYERLYRHASKWQSVWFKRMKAAESALAKPDPETDRTEERPA